MTELFREMNWTAAIAAGIYVVNIIAIIVVVFSERKTPTASLAWILLLALLPVVGFVFYIILNQNISRYHMNHMTDAEEELYDLILENQKKQMENIAPKDIFKLPVWHNDKMILLNPMEEISLIRAEQQKVIVSTNNGEYEINASLKDVEIKLKNLGFLRTHKSFIVNISKIREIIPWFNDTFILTLDNCSQKEIPVSRKIRNRPFSDRHFPVR